ncbi:hypothetical protein Glo7428_3225 [Gloeocapsa sp. PCC 7428]|nr:hypothetical protein Glo7428_3225 [Gloeocapsa sp. PCC 7428]
MNNFKTAVIISDPTTQTMINLWGNSWQRLTLIQQQLVIQILTELDK